MRIVFLYHSIAAMGGMERIWAERLNHLATHSTHEIFLITSDQADKPYSYALHPGVHHIDLHGIPFHSIYRHRYPMRLVQMLRFRHDYKKRLMPHLRAIDPDIIVNTNDHNIGFVANLPLRAKKIIECHLAKEFALRLKADSAEAWYVRLWKGLYDRHTCRVLRKFDCMTVLTRRDQYMWQEVRDTIVIPNSSRLYHDTKQPDTFKRIIAAGRLYPQKGFDRLISAWGIIADRYPDWHIDIYGEGGDRDKLQQQIEKMHLQDSVHILPPTEHIFQEYATADFLVMSSRYEGFGLVLVEAMSCGTPCISFDCPSGPADIIRNGENGMLIANGNIQGLARGMEKMIADDALRLAMGRQARMDAQQYSIDNIASQWLQLYETLTKA